MDALKTIEYKSYKINVYQDEADSGTPRDWDNLGTMVCFHNRYNLGDNHAMSAAEAEEMVKWNNVISLPLFLLDHSGITMNTSGFSCPLDSAQVGVIFVTNADVRKEYRVSRVSKQKRNMVLDVLNSEVKVYDQYLRGEVYGYIIQNKEGEDVDSCWGFFGDPEEFIIPECKSIIDEYAGLNGDDKK